MTPANITALQALVQADPALAQQLQSAATSSEISDAELEAVAGGTSPVPFQGPQGNQGNEGPRGVNGNPYWPSDPEYKSQTP